MDLLERLLAISTCVDVSSPWTVLSQHVQLFGAQKRAAIGMSTGSYSANRRHIGFIYSSPIVQSVPDEYRGKAQRTVAAKCALAIRADLNESFKEGAPAACFFSSSSSKRLLRTGSYGANLLSDINKKLDKLVEPPPAKVTKALPVPTEGPKKRRGGQRCVPRPHAGFVFFG
jgi:U4/U6 small nuclear ribonucleoprotein PRP31